MDIKKLPDGAQLGHWPSYGTSQKIGGAINLKTAVGKRVGSFSTLSSRGFQVKSAVSWDGDTSGIFVLSIVSSIDPNQFLSHQFLNAFTSLAETVGDMLPQFMRSWLTTAATSSSDRLEANGGMGAE